MERTYDSISLAQTPFASEFPIHFLASLQKCVVRLDRHFRLFFSPIGWHGLEIHDMLVKAESHIQPFPSAELVQMQVSSVRVVPRCGFTSSGMVHILPGYQRSRQRPTLSACGSVHKYVGSGDVWSFPGEEGAMRSSVVCTDVLFFF